MSKEKRNSDPMKGDGVHRKLTDERPFLKIGISTRDIERFKEKVDTSKYRAIPKNKKVRGNPVGFITL